MSSRLSPPFFAEKVRELAAEHPQLAAMMAFARDEPLDEAGARARLADAGIDVHADPAWLREFRYTARLVPVPHHNDQEAP